MMVGTIRTMMRFPVKSLLGESLSEATVDGSGLRGDRAYALLDPSTGRIASAKQPNLWRNLLLLNAGTGTADDADAIFVSDQSGSRIEIRDAAFDATLTEWVGRKVKLIDVRPAGLELNRARPDEVMIEGVDSLVTQDVLAIAAEAPNGGFFDFAPLHLMTSASLAAASAAAPDASIRVERYRPNLVIETPSSMVFAENHWVGRKLHVGSSVCIEVIAPTPRCAVPMLTHGSLPFSREAVAVVNTLNRIEFPLLGPGTFPCLGAYARVVSSGEVKCGDPVVLE